MLSLNMVTDIVNRLHQLSVMKRKGMHLSTYFYFY